MKQEALLVDLADQVREAKLATKTPLASDNGGAESAVDSDLKSRADDSMAEEPRGANKAKSAPFNANNMDQTREFWDKFDVGKPRASDTVHASRASGTLSRHARVVMILLPGMLGDGYLSLGRRKVVLHNRAFHTSLQKIKT